MKFYSIYLIGLVTFCGCDSLTTKDSSIQAVDSSLIPHENHSIKESGFKLSYSYAGLGSGYGSMQPTFRVKGADYVYNLEQNSSFTGEFDKKPEFICKGKLRTSSIDSIINLVKDIKDTLVYKTNTSIISGGIHYISVKKDKINITFQLHNAYDSIAQKIVDILNSNIPAEEEKLWLFDFQDEI